MGGVINKKGTDNLMYGVGYFGDGIYKARDEDHKMNIAYQKWFCMLQRCYCKEHLNEHEIYRGVIVDEKWHNYQKFAEWFYANRIDENTKYELDKDVLGGQIYSENTCLLLPQEINRTICRNKKRKDNNYLPVGVSLDTCKRYERYKVHSRINGKIITKYGFSNPKYAFLYYKKEKEKYIKGLADKYKNVISRVAYHALMNYEVVPFPYK